jgi:uncharacterized repeat protein (TIGR02543 family)
MYRLKTTAPGNSQLRILGRWGAIVFAGFLFSSGPAFAAPVTADTATGAVQGWLHQDRRPLGRQLSARVRSTEAVKNAPGEILYYVVQLDPSGFVILPADDLAEPIVAFSATGSFNASSGSAVAALVNRDLPRRMARARAGAPGASALKSHSKWRAFLAGSPNPPPDAEENGNIVVASQIWVAPFVQTLWSQTVDASLQDACYNYFTPPYGAGNVSNYPCGCVATALAQEMCYFQYPNTGVGTASFAITNNGVAQTTQLLGGNGTGGPYQWTNMPLSPNNPNTNQAMAIGYLTHDAGAAVNMDYASNNSAAATYLAQRALTNTFRFANAAYCENDGIGLSGGNLVMMINPNLDARLPVMLGVEYDGGHCLLCDGYGYSSSTLFHHLNEGFGGDDDIWYALPDIATVDSGDYTMVEACIYNIYTNGSGQIISGRVTDPTGAPVAGATITAVRSGGGTYTATTDTNGVYALARIPAASAYALTVTNAGDSSATNNYSTGTSVYNVLPSGNVWGANFVLAPPLLVIPETGFVSIGPANGPFSVMSQIYNLTNTSASPISWTLSNTNNWLSVTSTNGAVAAGGVSILTIALNSKANSLTNGTYTGSIWITNQNNGLAQQLQFSLSVAPADYPIAVTGYNLDVVVENTAVGGNTINYADTFDAACDFLTTSPPVCFYEAGLTVTNILVGGLAVPGLPQSGLFTSLVDSLTTFQFGPYDGNNVLYLTSVSNTGSLFLNTPAACKSLSVLAASAQGGGNGTLVIHFADGTSSSAIPFNAANYLTTNTPGSGAAITNFGLLVTGDHNEFGSVNNDYVFPTLYQTSINLQSLGLNTKLITSVTFTMPGGAGATASTVTGVFALSGTEALYTGNYNLTVSASPASGGTVSGGGPFAAGSTNTVMAAANDGYAFVNWTQGGIVASLSSSYTFTLNGDETLAANFLPTYSLRVSASPADGGTVSGGGTFPEGSTTNVTATANNGFEFIGWTGDATGTDNSLTFTVTSNLNITANFAAIGTNITVTVLTNGFGTVSPNLNGRDLKPDKIYTLTATAKNGSVVSNVFLNWTGSITTNKNPLAIKAESNMVLQANFIPNPFLPVKGTYNGLFFDTNNGVIEPTAGMLKGLAIGQKGTYSGTLLINGASHGISGRFDLAGQATNLISRARSQGGPLTVAMRLNWNEPPPQLTGTVSGTNSGSPWVASLIADRAANTVPSAQYTLLIPPQTGSVPPNSPGGAGYALITNHAGAASITGALADGTALSQSAPVSEDGYVPIYANLYTGKGLLLGWINLDLTNTSDVSLTWIHPGTRSGLYTNGFVNVLLTNQILLSHWTNSPGNFDGLTNLLMLETINNTTAEANIGVKITTLGKISGPSVSGSITPKTGLFTVTIGSGPAKVTGHGAILLNAGYGVGYFLTKTNAQAIILGP